MTNANIYASTNLYVKLADNPAFTDIEYSDLSMPTEQELGINTTQSFDNFTVLNYEPMNWLIFDPSTGEANSPEWTYANGNTDGDLADAGALMFRDPGAGLPLYKSHGSNYQFFTDGGPRNKGYTNISDQTWIRLNNYLGYQTNQGVTVAPYNQVWKTGALEFTIKPTKSNCTLLSGTLLGDSVPTTVTGSIPDNRPNVKLEEVRTGVDIGSGTDVLGAELKTISGPSQSTPYAEDLDYDITDGVLTILPNPKLGLVLSNTDHLFRTFNVDIVDGFLRVSYQIHYGDNKKKIELYSNQSVVDGNWHHIVINRPNPFTLKTSEKAYGGDGCIEIWIDGELDARSYEITTNDPIPTPNILFNTMLNSGIFNYSENLEVGSTIHYPHRAWMTEEIAKTNYVGGIRDFIFRQTIPMTGHDIHLNYVYAMLNAEGANISKAAKATATASMAMPTVSVNKKNVLKLYWNTLLDDKEKCLNGLELDDTFNVYSYSVTKKNIISPTQTFNLDLNDSSKNVTFLEDVKAAIGKHVFIPKPGILFVPQAYSGIPSTYPQKTFQYDYLNDKSLINQYWANDALFTNNLQYGGVYLESGDRVLLFNQPRSDNNGVWIFNGPDKRMTRPSDIALSNYQDAVVYVKDGKYAGKTFIQTNEITNIRTSAQKWIEVDNNISLSASDVYPIHTASWADEKGNERFIDVNNDIDIDYDVIVFMNYPSESKDIYSSLTSENETTTRERYKEFIDNLKLAVNNGKSLYVSSPLLAVDLGIVSKVTYVPQLLDETGDGQAAAISPFESGEPAEYYFDTHRNMKYSLVNEIAGLTDKETYIMSDFVTYSPDRTNSDYHIKYNYRQFGLQEGDEFYIPGLTLVPETLNKSLPGYIYAQKGTDDFVGFNANDILMGTIVTELSNNIYTDDDATPNPYDDIVTTIAVNYGTGKMFVNCVENAYAMSRSDYNKGIVQNPVAGQNAETVQTAAWQYSTKRLNKKNLFDFSETTNSIGQTDPTNGGGGPIVQAQSHCSNGVIRKNTTKGDLQFQSDLYADFTEEVFTTTEIPVLSMTWLGLQWLAG